MNKNIRNYNSKGEWHGYITHGLWYRGNYKNDKPIGYHEFHDFEETKFYIR